MVEDKMGELLHCPFCGTTPKRHGARIGCVNKDCWGPAIWHMANPEDSVAAWNRRAASVGITDEMIERAAIAAMKANGCGVTIEGQHVLCDSPSGLEKYGDCECRKMARAALSSIDERPKD